MISRFRRGLQQQLVDFSVCLVVAITIGGSCCLAQGQNAENWYADTGNIQQVQYSQRTPLVQAHFCRRCNKPFRSPTCQDSCCQCQNTMPNDYGNQPVLDCPQLPSGYQDLALPGSEMTPVQESPIVPSVEPNLGFSGRASLGQTTSVVRGSNTMYLDDAIIARQFRIRFDAAYDNPVPDRAEFFYGQCGCFNNVVNPPTPAAPGPPRPETRVDYQDYSMYLELAPRDRFSAFIEIPIRSINPEVNENESGLSDIITGFKLGLINCEDRFCTFQFKIYTPTGDAFKGLGTGHASLEPGFLFQRRVGPRLTWNAELRDWIPLSESNIGGRLFAGNVLRYGVGLGYDIWQEAPICNSRYCGNVNPDCRRLTLMTEFVGWSVLSGLQSGSRPDGTDDADGTGIFNAKLGLRYTMNGGGSVGISYGRALTGDTWYSDIARLEYRLMF